MIDLLITKFLKFKNLIYQLIFFLFKKKAKSEIENRILEKEISNSDKLEKRIVDAENQEEEIAAQPNPDINDINQWLRRPRDKNRKF